MFQILTLEEEGKLGYGEKQNKSTRVASTTKLQDSGEQ